MNAYAFLTKPRPWSLCRAEPRRPSSHREGKGSLRVRASRQKTIWTAASDFLDALDGRIAVATQCNEMDVAVFALFAAAAVIHDSYLWSVSLLLSPQPPSCFKPSSRDLHLALFRRLRRNRFLSPMHEALPAITAAAGRG